MGSSHSQPQGLCFQRITVSCDASGCARFQYENNTGQPGRPGYYVFMCREANMNEFNCRGLMVDGQTTRSSFAWRMPAGNRRLIRYCPGPDTPYCKGFSGSFTAVPNQRVTLEMWWYPLDG